MPEIVSTPSSIDTETLSVTDWWLIDPDLGTALKLRIWGPSFDTDRLEDQGIFQPLGRDRDIVVSDVVRGNRFTLRIYFDNQADFDTFETLRARVKPLLLRSDMNDQWWIKLGSARPAALLHVGGRVEVPRRKLEIAAVEVDEPL